MITLASTFSGIGAPEVAAEMLGWENVFHCEINPFGRRVLDYYFPKAKSYEDITRTDFSEWRDRITVLTGGFPCQPFSYAGKRRGSEDDRYLWPFMLRCIEQVRPRWFVGENVAGITTMAFPGEDVKVGEQTDLFGACDEVYEKHERYVLDEICQSLERAGYSVQPMLIPACAVGAPHRRDRVFIVAHDTRDRLRQDITENSLCMGPHATEQLADEQRPRNHWTASAEWNSEATTQFRVQWRGDGWKPSQPLTIRGNYGLPSPVDHLTIPFSEWKRESLKAYGNAIVQQVMYEIFRCIDEIEKTLNPE